VICTPERLVLRFPILPVLPASLPELRRRWLRQVLRDAQTHGRLVRLGYGQAANEPAVLAECDLTGAPATLLRPMILVCLECLRYCVGGLAETVEFLADATVASRALELCPLPETQPQPAKEQ
jgi:hypothetical protein